MEDPDAAVAAYKALTDWIYGFSKNSRNHHGLDIFFFSEERNDIYALHFLIKNLKTMRESDIVPPPPFPDPEEEEEAGPSGLLPHNQVTPERSTLPYEARFFPHEG